MTLDPIPADGWNVELSGLVSEPRSVAVEDLSGYEQIERELVLQCSGNGRSFYSGSVRTRGTQWAKGGVGNVRWKGVPLTTLVAELGIKVDSKGQVSDCRGQGRAPGRDGARFRTQCSPAGCARDRASRDGNEWGADPGDPRRPGTSDSSGLLRHDEHQVAQPASLRSGRVQQSSPFSAAIVLSASRSRRAARQGSFLKRRFPHGVKR